MHRTLDRVDAILDVHNVRVVKGAADVEDAVHRLQKSSRIRGRFVYFLQTFPDDASDQPKLL